MPRLVLRSSLFLLCALGLVLVTLHLSADDPAPSIMPYAQSAVLFASDGAIDSQFGQVIVVQGSLAAVSAPLQHLPNNRYMGTVYLFERDSDGWKEIGRLANPPYLQKAHWFGAALAIDGDNLAVLVGAVEAPANPQLQGAVFVYRRVGNEWQPPAVPLLPDKEVANQFGEALALDGNTLAVSGAGSSPEAHYGVYIFTRTGQTWTQQAWLAEPPGFTNWYPTALALHGDVLLVGSPYANDQGLVTLYRRSGNNWELESLLPGPADQPTRFGRALDFDGETAAITACAVSPHDGDNYVQLYSIDGNTWALQESLSLVVTPNRFECRSLMLEGQRLVVSAEETYDPHDPLFPGGAFLFQKTGGKWKLRQVLRPSDVQPGDHYAWIATLAGDEVLVGAMSQNRLNAGYRGAVHVFNLRPAGSGTVLLPLTARSELSPTEGLIVFQAFGTGGASDLFISTADGRGRTPLTQTPVNEFEPDWSPDGRSVVFVQDGGGNRRLVTLDIASGQLTIIGPPGDIIYSLPRWSPDGQRIAFTDDWGGVGDIFVVDWNGDNLINLTDTHSFNESMPDWSPDSAHLVYQSDDGLRIMDADGGNNHPLPGTSPFASTPDWSPDGQSISYTVRSDDWTLHTISATGGVPVVILNEVMNGRWSPDSQSIVFNGTGGGLFRVILSTGEMTTINPDRSATHPVEQP